MNISRIVIPVVILVVGVVGFIALEKSKSDEKTETPDGPGVPVVEVEKISIHEGTLDIGVDGQAVPYQEIELSAEVAGRIVYKAEVARAGRFTRKDNVLLRIDDTDYSLMVQQLDSELQQANNSLQELDEEIAGSERLVVLAQNDLDRQSKIHREGYGTDAELDQALRDKTTVSNKLKLLKAQKSRLKQAATLTDLKKKKAEHDQQRAEIKAPVNGVIVHDSVENGDYVTIGTPLLTIEDTTAIEVKCNLQMDELYWVWDQAAAHHPEAEIYDSSDRYQIPPTPATVIYRLEGDEYSWEGELWRIDGVGLDEKTRTVPCRVIVRSPQAVLVGSGDARQQATSGPPALVRGMYVDVVIHTKPSQTLLSVPQEAVRPGPEVWLARESPANEKGKSATGEATAEHTLVIVAVNVIESDGKRTIVRANSEELFPGTKVIVSPLALSPKDRADAGQTNAKSDKERPFLLLVKEKGEETK